MQTYEKVSTAEEYARRQHFHQKRNDGRTPYSVHLENVVKKLQKLGIKDEDVLCAGWLHDTIEDTNTDFENISERFGPNVAEVVSSLTKDKRLPEGERERSYIEALARANWKVQVVKFCDIWANIEDLKSGYPDEKSRRRQVDKNVRYFEAIRYGLSRNASNIPNIKSCLEDLNRLLSEYQRFISL